MTIKSETKSKNGQRDIGSRFQINFGLIHGGL